MSYSLAYLAGVGAKHLKLSAAEVPASGDDYAEVLNGMRHPSTYLIIKIKDDLQHIIDSATYIKDTLS